MDRYGTMRLDRSFEHAPPHQSDPTKSTRARDLRFQQQQPNCSNFSGQGKSGSVIGRYHLLEVNQQSDGNSEVRNVADYHHCYPGPSGFQCPGGAVSKELSNDTVLPDGGNDAIVSSGANTKDDTLELNRQLRDRLAAVLTLRQELEQHEATSQYVQQVAQPSGIPMNVSNISRIPHYPLQPQQSQPLTLMPPNLGVSQNQMQSPIFVDNVVMPGSTQILTSESRPVIGPPVYDQRTTNPFSMAPGYPPGPPQTIQIPIVPGVRTTIIQQTEVMDPQIQTRHQMASVGNIPNENVNNIMTGTEGGWWNLGAPTYRTLTSELSNQLGLSSLSFPNHMAAGIPVPNLTAPPPVQPLQLEKQHYPQAYPTVRMLLPHETRSISNIPGRYQDTRNNAVRAPSAAGICTGSRLPPPPNLPLSSPSSASYGMIPLMLNSSNRPRFDLPLHQKRTDANMISLSDNVATDVTGKSVIGDPCGTPMPCQFNVSSSSSETASSSRRTSFVFSTSLLKPRSHQVQSCRFKLPP